VKYRYEIDSKNAVRIYSDEQEAPIIFQPDYPNGDAWTLEQATAWAEAYLAYVTDETAPLPGISAEEPTMPRPVEAVEETAPTEE
jgi:hypothetical protein